MKWDKRAQYSDSISYSITTRNVYTEPRFRTIFGEYSFTRISVKVYFNFFSMHFL